MGLQRSLVLTVCLVIAVGAAGEAFAQMSAPAPGAPTSAGQGPAGPGGAPRGPRGPRPKPTNLQALPKDLSGDDVIKYMHEYEGALGVECQYCHATNAETKRMDTISDANPMKAKARTMIQMTAEINAKYLAELGSAPAPAPVQCGTCHRGQAKPPAFVPKPEAPRVVPGGAAAPAMKPM